MHKFALAGNPNSGKTTLFNALTGSTAYVGNWAGVTVEKRAGKYRKLDEHVEIVDLPGIYSLSPYTPEEVISRNYILDGNPDNIVLIDKYVMGTEIEVDAICDGEDILIPGIMEHIERAGIHSGDSIAVYPSQNISDKNKEEIIEYTRQLATALNTKGLVNIQYIISDGKIYVIEVNPRSSRTIPYISKVTGVPMIKLATECMVGKKLKKLGFGTGLYPSAPYVAVKVPFLF